MPLGFAEFHQVEKNVDALFSFLSAHREEFPENFHSSLDYLIEELEQTLVNLQTDQGILRDNINEVVADGSDWKYRRSHLRSLNENRYGFIRKLLPKAHKLYDDLVKEPDTQALAEELITILAPIEEQYLPGRNVDLESGISSSESIEGQVPISPPIIDRDALTALMDLQHGLNILVLGYIASRKQQALCDEIRAKLQKAVEDPAYTPRGFWGEVNDLIEDAHWSMNKDFPLSLRSDLYEKFMLALQKAQQNIESVSSTSLQGDDRPAIQKILTNALNHIDSAIRRVISITQECEKGAITQVPLIDQKIKDIFKKEVGPSKGSESSIGAQRTVNPREQQEKSQSTRTVERAEKTPGAPMTTSRPA